jgi:hypothetical protein
MFEPAFLRPQNSVNLHPIETGDYLIGTPSTFEFFTIVRKWLDTSQPGGLVFGPPRYGKTRAIRYISRQLNSEFAGTLPILSFICYEHKKANENIFFEELLDGVGHFFSDKGKALAKRKRLYQYLRSITDKHPYKRLLFFFDEAQNLQDQHYSWLVDLFNMLDAVKIKPLFVLVGQKELAYRHTAMLHAKRYQIIGRFMINSHKFRGLSSATDIEVCLNGYDKMTEYPIGSKWSFTRYYFPVAYLHGWRILSQANTIWEAFLNVKKEAKIPGYDELPMQFFSSAVEYIFKKYYNLKDIEPHLSMKMWKEAFKQTGYTLCQDFIFAGEK